MGHHPVRMIKARARWSDCKSSHSALGRAVVAQSRCRNALRAIAAPAATTINPVTSRGRLAGLPKASPDPAAEKADQRASAELTEHTEPTDATDPIEHAEPTEPIERKLPLEAIDKNE